MPLSIPEPGLKLFEVVPFTFAYIRYGEKWRPRSKRRQWEKENGGLGEGEKIKTERKRVEF